VETEEYVEFRKPHWLFLDASRDDEMKYGLFNYAPLAHYDLRIQELEDELDEVGDDDLVTDGGSRTKYYWSSQEGILYHTEKGEDVVMPFFHSEEDAGDFIERQAELHGKEQYKGMVLRKTGDRKVAEAEDYIYDDSELTDFITDGGYDQNVLELAEAAEEIEW